MAKTGIFYILVKVELDQDIEECFVGEVINNLNYEITSEDVSIVQTEIISGAVRLIDI